MAVQSRITPFWAGEVARPGNSCIPAAFTEFLHALDILRRADGAAAELDPWDPAMATAPVVAADDAFRACRDAAQALCAMLPMDRQDRALVDTAGRVLAMLCAEHPDDLVLAAAGLLTDATLAGPGVDWPVARARAIGLALATIWLADTGDTVPDRSVPPSHMAPAFI